MGYGGVVGDPQNPIRGRGASGNSPNRFERIEYELEDEERGEESPRPKTRFYSDHSKTIISTHDSPDLPMKAGLNPYRGCEHGCIYCYARPYHEYLGFSPGLDFETQIVVKENAPQLLRQELSSKRWQPQQVAVSGATDVYQPAERTFQLTRRCLEVFRDFRNPVGIITKNRLVTRDIDILQEMAEYDCAAVFLSITTLDLELNRVLEPRTSSPQQRLDAIHALSEAGIPVGVMMAPVIPGLTDSEMLPIIEAAADAGAQFAGYIVLRLPHAVAPMFERWLEEHYPNHKDKVLNRVRSMRGGDLYKSEFGSRMKGEGIFAEQIKDMFRVACRKAGIDGDSPELTTEHFRRPEQSGDQLTLV